LNRHLTTEINAERETNMDNQLELTDDDIGKIFIRDANYRNGGKVRLLSFGHILCEIKDVEKKNPTPYNSMINRLTRITVADEKDI